MNNVFNINRKLEKIYDLKGSIIDRKARKNPTDKNITLKDLDF